MKNLSVLVPFYNEEATLELSINRLIDCNIAEKIILINDCSTDNSLEIANNLVKKYEFLELISCKENVGKGGAVKNALSYVDSDFLIIHDADLEYDPKDITKLLKKANEQKSKSLIILGSRFIDNVKRNNIYLRTYIANKFLSFLFSVTNKKKVTDIATCYKLLPKAIYKNISLEKNGFDFEVEILSKSLKLADSHFEIPISYNGRSYSEGKKIKFTDGVKYIICILKFKV